MPLPIASVPPAARQRAHDLGVAVEVEDAAVDGERAAERQAGARTQSQAAAIPRFAAGVVLFGPISQKLPLPTVSAPGPKKLPMKKPVPLDGPDSVVVPGISRTGKSVMKPLFERDVSLQRQQRQTKPLPPCAPFHR